MTDALGPIAYIVALFAIAAGMLWFVEAIAKLIGRRGTWLLLLFALPLALSIALSVRNWAVLAWWQKALYPIAGPALAGAVLFLGFAVVNPADALSLIVGSVRRAWRCVSRGGRSQKT